MNTSAKKVKTKERKKIVGTEIQALLKMCISVENRKTT